MIWSLTIDYHPLAVERKTEKTVDIFIYTLVIFGLSMISIRHLILLMLLAVYKCSSSDPLSLIQGHVSTIYYFGTTMSPKIIPWYNNKVNNYFQTLIIGTDEAITFTAICRETMNCLDWFSNNLKQNNKNPNPGTIAWEISENKILSLDAINSNYSIFGRTYLINFI